MNKRDLVIIGGGPGGYTAAFRAADLGHKVTIIERDNTLGGVCLNYGCIPSKTLLNIAAQIENNKKIKDYGVEFTLKSINMDTIREHKNSVVKTLTAGLAFLAKKRKVEIIHGEAYFKSGKEINITTKEGESVITFKSCIIAAGSIPLKPPVFPYDDKRIWDSKKALELENIPKKLLIVGGGIIGLEMATVYNSFGSEITIVEMLDQIIPGADSDVVKPLFREMINQKININLEQKVESIKAQKQGLLVSHGGKEEIFDNALISIGRVPNSKNIKIENTDVKTDKHGFIVVNDKMETNVPGIFAIGDITGHPQLAHKAAHEGKVAAEVISGYNSVFIALTIPSVVYTHPEIAWTGLTEREAKEKGIKYKLGKFPFSASGRSISQGNKIGFTKVLFSEESKRIIGAAIAGPDAGEMITEASLAIEMGADAEDMGRTIHPHPTLSETLALAAEVASGTATDI